VATPVAEAALHGVGYLPRSPAHQRGKASYYHDNLAGNRTASGEIYVPAKVSAAHKTLPFGTVGDVVRDDGRWLRVRINDRGPFIKGRVIDLSRRGAELLDLIEAGIADVSLYIVSKPPKK